jgi:hypothetical protein
MTTPHPGSTSGGSRGSLVKAYRQNAFSKHTSVARNWVRSQKNAVSFGHASIFQSRSALGVAYRWQRHRATIGQSSGEDQAARAQEVATRHFRASRVGLEQTTLRLTGASGHGRQRMWFDNPAWLRGICSESRHRWTRFDGGPLPPHFHGAVFARRSVPTLRPREWRRPRWDRRHLMRYVVSRRCRSRPRCSCGRRR